MDEVFRLFQNAIEALRHSRAKPETIPRLLPEAVNILRAFSGYARRAESAPGTSTPADPPKSQASVTRTPKEECEELMNALLPMVKKLLSEHGEFFPVGGTMQADGSIAFVSTYDGDEHPPSQKVIDSLIEAFRAGAMDRKYKATALIYDIRTVPPGATEKTDAVAVRLDHVSGYSVLVVFPYRLSPVREVIFTPPFASKGPADIFSKP